MTAPGSPVSRASGGAGNPAGAGPSLSERAGDQAVRAVAFLAGLGLLGGFFLPWLRFGEVAAVSGLSLMVSSGTAVTALAGPAKGMLIIVPVCGGALVACAVLFPRLAGLATFVGGLSVIGFGLFTLARAFFQTVGTGMWIVVLSALVAAATGLVALSRRRGSA